MTKIVFFIISLSWLFSQTIRVQLGNGLSINILDIAIGIAAVMIFIWFVSNKKIYLLVKDNLGKGILIFTGIMILSLFSNISSLNIPQFIISGMYIVRWICYLLVFFYVRESNHEYKNKVKKVMQITGIVFVIAGYLQVFYFNSLKSLFYLGWDEHMYRFFSVFLDPNYSGIFMVLFLLFIFGKRMEMPINPLTKTKLFLSIITAFTVGGIILTFSRSAYVSLFSASAIILFLIGKKRWIFAIFGIMLVVAIVLSQRFYIENINPFRSFSSKERLSSMKQSVEIFLHKPFLGVGFNAYRYSQLRYGFKQQANINTSHADSGTDNSFLFVLVTTGLVGFTAYCIMFVILMKYIYKSFIKKRHIYSAVAFSSIIALATGSFFINALFFPPLMIWMWALLGTMEE